MDKLALKRLTASDLTFFKWHFVNRQAGKQKALNLSRNVFVDELYPMLARKTTDSKYPVSLYLYGPGVAEAHILQRKILKTPSYKNWRLNGELIYPPEDDPERFNVLEPGDLALMGFEGASYPTAVYIDFIARNNSDDKSLFDPLDNFLGRPYGNMKRITINELENLVDRLDLPHNHPIYRYIINEDLIETVQGDAEAQLRVYRKTGRVMSSDELKNAKQKSDETGRRGEELVAFYLQKMLIDGDIIEYEWTSKENSIAPYDFKIRLSDGKKLRIDVKSTTGNFSTPLHISTAELITMAENAIYDYLLYRVYNLTEDGGMVRVSNPMSDYAQTVLKIFCEFPLGTRVDSISCSPEKIAFNEEISLNFEDEGE